MKTIFKNSRDELTFRKSDHAYFLNSVSIPSVTQILTGSGLSDYSKVPEDILERAAKLGKAVHDTTHFHTKGTLDTSSLDPVLNLYLEQWMRFLKMHVDLSAPRCSEIPVYCKKSWYAGTADFWGIVNGEPAVVEIKTTKKQMEAHKPQVAAYRNAYAPAKKCYLIYLSETNFDLVPVNHVNAFKDFRLATEFLSMRKKYT